MQIKMRCYLTTNVIGQCFKNHIIYCWQKMRSSPTLLIQEFKLVHFKKQLGNACKVEKMFIINTQQYHCWIYTTETSVLGQGDVCTIVGKKWEMENHLHSHPKRNSCIRAGLQLTLLPLPLHFLPPSFLCSQTRATQIAGVGAYSDLSGPKNYSLSNILNARSGINCDLFSRWNFTPQLKWMNSSYMSSYALITKT